MILTAGMVLLGAAGCSRKASTDEASAASTTPAPASAAISSALAASPPPPAWLGTAYAPAPDGTRPTAAALTTLGRALFFEPALSASGRTSCNTCHDARAAFGPSNARAVQLAGADGRTPGTRATPSLRYLQTLPPFSEHTYENEGDDSIDAGPTGGHDWDGRASSAHDQARGPLLSANEMANANEEGVVARLEASASAGLFRRTFGARVFADRQAAFDGAVLALEAFEQAPADFYPYSSRYDAVLRGKATLSAAETRGLEAFNDPARGNCAACHRSAIGADGAFPLFTDFGHIALGVPRNRTLPVNADANYQDRGLCGPLRTDFIASADRTDYCGRFRTPSLRNVAVRRVFFHNGVFASLREVLAFYAGRDSEPQRFYPRDAAGRVLKFDDLGPRFHANVNTDAPFGRERGAKPALSEAEIGDIIAFLQTLTDEDVALPSLTARVRR